MPEEKVQGQADQTVAGEKTVILPQTARRKLLKSTVAIPVIMTLHSGAALAKSSNMLTPVQAGDAHQINNQYVCVNIAGGPTNDPPPYDVGDMPTATLVADPNNCTPGNGGILVSSGAYQSLTGKGMLPPQL